MGLLTNSYKQLLTHAHNTTNWGGGAYSKAKHVHADASVLNALTILDYGCGNGSFKRGIEDAGYPYSVFEYDPGVNGKDAEPTPADYLVSIDVLEHIEPDCLDDVLRHMASLMRLGGFLHPCLVPAGLILKDGRNAHLIVENAQWWRDRISEHFVIHSQLYETKGHLGVYVRPK